MKLNSVNNNGTISVTIPKKIAESLGWQAGDEVDAALMSPRKDKDSKLGILFYKKGNKGYELSIKDGQVMVD